jgi:hypothetical protein
VYIIFTEGGLSLRFFARVGGDAADEAFVSSAQSLLRLRSSDPPLEKIWGQKNMGK